MFGVILPIATKGFQVDTRSVQVRHPQSGDLVGSQITIAGIGHGFEGTIVWRLRRGEETLIEGFVTSAGGMVALAGFATTAEVPVLTRGPATLQVFGDNPGLPDEGPDPGFDLNEVPVVIVPGMYGFGFHEVKAGETLTSIAAESDGVTVDNIVAANPDITDPDKVQAGSVLRIPYVG